MDYADQHGIGWLNWSFNPDSGDTGGLLSDDWLSVVQAKTDLYRGHLAPALDVGSSGVFGLAQSRLSVQGKTTSPAPQTNNIGLVLQIVNDGPTSVNLSELELRYWFRPGISGPSGKGTQMVDIDYAAPGASNVTAQISPPDQVGNATLHVQFMAGAGSIKPYASSGDIALRVHRSDWSAYDQTGNFSFRSNTNPAEWDHVALYRGGAHVLGIEPGAGS